MTIRSNWRSFSPNEQRRLLLLILAFASHLPCVDAQQPLLAEGLEPARQRIKNTLGGFYSGNVTLYFRNSPYRVEQELIVESGCTLTIETGVQMYFDTGVGIKVFGTLRAVGNEFAHIQMLSYQEQLAYDHQLPEFRLIDGPTVRQGRLQARFRDRWRSVCTQVTNWTSVDTGAACRSMGYSDGAFWRYFRRNNDTYPLVMARPECAPDANSLWDCPGFADPERIPLSENLCQGEDDLGLYCWGRPTFRGWAKHWKGLQIYHSPFHFVPADPDGVAVQRESLSRIEFLDILYAGYDALTKNATAALYVEGVPPLMNGIRVEHSARDGVYFFEPEGPILIANSTVSHNRGHGIAVENALDGRVFINQTHIEGNYGDGIWYRQKHLGLSPTQNSLGLEVGVPRDDPRGSLPRHRRQSGSSFVGGVGGERARLDMCVGHQLDRQHFFPHLVRAHLQNGSAVSDPLLQPYQCWMSVSLPARLPYVYTIQFLDVSDRHPVWAGAHSWLVVCDGNDTVPAVCQSERYRMPLLHGVLPQSVSLNSNGQPMFVGLQHLPRAGSGTVVAADVDVLFRVHASVNYKAFYGLNVTNSAVLNNTGNGIQAMQVRERTALHNVTVEGNQGLAGLLVRDGAADIWLNDSSLSWNWGDGVNISFAGGSINLNTSRLVGNRWRGFAFHHNSSIPFWPLRQEIVIKGRPANNVFYPRMLIAGNAWGGLLVGNFCAPANAAASAADWPDWAWSAGPEPKVLVNWAEFADNRYHPHIEVFSCQRQGATQTHVDISGNTVLGGTGIGFRMEPCVNAELVLNSNRLHGIRNTALLVRNARHPQLAGLPARVQIAKNDIKMNTGQYIVSIGLNEDAPRQSLVFNQQNEVRSNTVLNPFPFLKPRSTPYAALVVSSSSNVLIRHNCFGNPRADFEIGTELMEHAKHIDARENNWGDPQAHNFMHRIFDQFNRYSLASIDVNPYAAVCNQRAPVLTLLQQFFRRFRQPSQPFLIGGTVFENSDLPAGRYTVSDDLHITPGAKLTLAPGTTLEFMNGVGMLVQGELLRNDLAGAGPLQPIVFTSRPLGQPPQLEQVRLVDEFGDENVLAGRLEVRLEPEGQWGTVCNRSWTAQHAQLACNQLGLSIDPEHFENWRIFPPPGELPIVMDNVRCEEREWDLTRCRHDGPLHNVRASCRPTEVVGVRCAPPYWAGVRYSLLANPPSVTGQPAMNNWVLERAGLFDFRTATFSPALQIDWNYHSFHELTVKDNFHDGVDIVYNDLTRKPAIRNSLIARNRRNGLVVRSMGLSAEKMRIEQNGNAGVRYLPMIPNALQRDIVAWLDRQEQPELEANGIYVVPNRAQRRLQVFESQLDQRKFLVAKANEDCPPSPLEPCAYELELEAVGHEYGLPPKLVVQLVNRPSNESDEDAVFEDRQTARRWSARHNTVEFPLLASGPRLRMLYRRSQGPPQLIVLVLFLDHQEYLDRFVHVYDSVVRNNQYGVSALHHSNLSLAAEDALVNRYSQEKLWFQRVNFTANTEAVLWAHSPEYAVQEGTPLTHIGWHVDNCSVDANRGPIVDTHRDLFASANVFHWNFWSNTFANNSDAGVRVHLPDAVDLRAQTLREQQHSFSLTENRFEANRNFLVQLSGYYAFANISSNNFTDNWAIADQGIVSVLGMEKRLVMGRNRFFSNWGHWVVRVEALSHALRAEEVPALIQYNYFQFNHFLHSTDEYVEMWPRSFAIGVFGVQPVQVHFNRLRNVLMDFELVAACRPQLAASDGDVLNATHNWWGVANEAELSQRIFDVEDWNSLSGALFSPYYTTEELFIVGGEDDDEHFWWRPERGQLSQAPDPRTVEPSLHDLRGRVWGERRLELDPERWYSFPYHYRPFRPYRITRDLTIMPGATLTIEKNVEVHVWPNVRILVYGNLVADGTLWQPIRFKPINATEQAQQLGRKGTRYRRSRTPLEAVRLASRQKRLRRHHRLHALDTEMRHLEQHSAQKWRMLSKRTATTFKDLPEGLSPARPGRDDVFRQFPDLRREWPRRQRLSVRLVEQGPETGKEGRRGFLHFYNATSGEVVPSCDRHFTLRNAQVVCRELGLSAQNAYHWLTPQWDYNPQTRLVKTYMEPRECRGNERRLDECKLRITGRLSDWQCMDNEHFNYVHCGTGSALWAQDYVGHWGGITFARHSLEQSEERGPPADASGGDGDRSVLRHVEIVGGGNVHNDSLFGAALQVVQRSPLMENVNVTNSSMHALQIVHPSSNMVLSRLNISDNLGLGVNILSANLQSTSGATGAPSSLPRGPLNLPYQLPGVLDMCAAGRQVQVRGRVLLFYKYDSYPVDCVKVFRSANGRQHLGFRFIQANLYSSPVGVPRPDALSVYSGASFSVQSLLRNYTAHSSFELGGALPTQFSALSLHLRATAADGEYGFLAEVATLPTAPLSGKGVEEVAVRLSRLLNNDRGALHYRNVGEVGPNVIVEQCAIDSNGYHLYGNISTSLQAAELHLHNTMLLVFRANSLRYNRGGLLLSSNSSSSVARMSAVLKSNAIAFNSNSSSLALFGNGVQRVIALNNLITHNYALYADTIRASGVLANMSHNLVSANVGWHTVDTQSTVDAQMHFLDNFFEANLALGHGNQYAEKYGFHDGNERDEFLTRRPKRQVLAQRGVSFDWWTHVEPAETGRYRSTILACSPHQHFARNVFNNPLNDFELTTGPLRDTQLQFDAAAAVDARLNYWGPPGTVGVAAGKIRDQRDDKRLVRVDFQPLLESNTSLIEGDCPPGWFQVGQEEFKSCFLFVGASSTYADAVQFCQRLGAFMPILRNADARRNELARRIDALGQRYVTDVERQNSFGGIVYDVPIWVSAVSIPSNQCGWMSSRTASIGEHNCHNLLPFVCERGTKPYQEPLLWRREVVLIAVLLVLLLMCVALLGCCAWRKRQRKRQEEFPRTKQHLRDSLRNSKQQKIGRSATDFVPLEAFGPTLKGPVDERTFTSLTDYGDRQQHFSSMSTSAASCGKTRTEKKLSDESCSSFSGSQCACASNSRWGHATNCHTCAMYSTVPADESIRSSAESSASSSCCTSSSLTPPSSSGDVSSDSTLTLTAQRPLLNYKRRRPPAPPPPAEASRAQQNQHYHFEFATPSLTGTLSNPNIAYRPRPRPDLHQQAQQRHSGFFPAPPPLSARDRDVPKNRNLSAASQELGASEETLRHQEPVEPRHHWANAPPPAVSLRPRQPPPIAPRRQQQPRIRVSMEAITPLETSM